MAICKICGVSFLVQRKGLRMYLAKMISAQIVLRHLGVFTIWAVI